MKKPPKASWRKVGRRVGVAVVAGALATSPTTWAFAEGNAPVAAPSTAPGAAPTKAAASSPPVSAADLSTAKKRYADGEKKYRAADYAGALVEFKAANDIKAAPQAERYVGLCEDALGHYALASEWYDKFLAHVPDKMSAAGDETRKRQTEIRAMPGKLHLESNPSGALVSIDDKPPLAVTPLDAELAPGAHKVRITAQGRQPAERAIDVSFASMQAVAVELEPDAAPVAPPIAAPPAQTMAPAAVLPVAPPPPAEPRSLVPAYVTGGLAIAAAGVGTVFGIVALNDKSDFDKNPTSSTADSGDTHSLVSDMAFGVAITFGVTSAVLFLTKDEPAPSASVSTSKAVASTQGSPTQRVAGMGSTREAPTSTVAVERRRKGPSFLPVPLAGPHWGGGGLVVRF